MGSLLPVLRQWLALFLLILAQIKDLIRAEFLVLKEEWKRLYRADIEKINEEIQQLNNKLEDLGNKVRVSESTSSSGMEDVLEELQERERRACNLIFFDVEEARTSDSINTGVAVE